MKNGLLVPAVHCIIRVCYWLNVVEYVKLFSICIYATHRSGDFTVEHKRLAASLGIDFFQLAKYLAIVILLLYDIPLVWTKYVVYYLITSNAFIYFYYHAWGSQYLQRDDLNSQRRRLLNLLLAIVFYILCYAYLYKVHFAQHIQWPDGQIDTTNAVYLSVANAFTLTYGGFAPKTQIVRVLFMSELINTFLFFTIVVSNSIPSLTTKE